MLNMLRRVARTSVAEAVALYVRLSWKLYVNRTSPHVLPKALTVTLTSYPPRFTTLDLTLKSLLSQSIKPDRLCLWIAASDLHLVPENVRKLESHGLVILPCNDTGSYKKLIPSLNTWPGNFFVTADDDCFYGRDWLKQLVEAYQPDSREVICGRAHRIRLNSTGLPLPYQHWETNIRASAAEPLIFPTGLAGVLYAPQSFHVDVTDVDKFSVLCPTADDVWLYWMAAINGVLFRKVGPPRRQITWAGSQRVALFHQNLTANDKQLANMIDHYGFSFSRTIPAE